MKACIQMDMVHVTANVQYVQSYDGTGWRGVEKPLRASLGPEKGR